MLHAVLVVNSIQEQQAFLGDVLDMQTLRYRDFADGSANGFSGLILPHPFVLRLLACNERSPLTALFLFSSKCCKPWLGRAAFATRACLTLRPVIYIFERSVVKCNLLQLAPLCAMPKI
jgi:hypothetical protein